MTALVTVYVRTMAGFSAEMNRRLYRIGAHCRRQTPRAAARSGLAARHLVPSALGRPDVDVAVRRLDEANGGPEAERDFGRQFR